MAASGLARQPSETDITVLAAVATHQIEKLLNASSDSTSRDIQQQVQARMSGYAGIGLARGVGLSEAHTCSTPEYHVCHAPFPVLCMRRQCQAGLRDYHVDTFNTSGRFSAIITGQPVHIARPTHSHMNPLLSGVSRSLVEKTEKALSIQIKAELSPDLAVGSQARIQDMKETGVLVILLKPDRQDHQYLIAQGCMSALATREAPFSLRSTGNGEAQFAQTLAERGIENAAALAKHLATGTASQLRGAPLLALAAHKIYNEYPELRDDQLKYFKLDCAEGALALTQAPEKFDGALVNAHHAMNGAVALVADYLFQNTRFYEPFQGTPSDTVATQLVEDLYGVNVLETEQEIVMSWIEKLSLSDFYRVVAD